MLSCRSKRIRYADDPWRIKREKNKWNEKNKSIAKSNVTEFDQLNECCVQLPITLRTDESEMLAKMMEEVSCMTCSGEELVQHD